MKRIFVPTRSDCDWQPLLKDPIKHWKEGRSAMTTAACWEAAGTRLPPEVAAVLDQSDRSGKSPREMSETSSKL